MTADDAFLRVGREFVAHALRRLEVEDALREGEREFGEHMRRRQAMRDGVLLLPAPLTTAPYDVSKPSPTSKGK